MATVIKIKRGDTARLLTDTLTLDGEAIDLTSAVVVLVWHDGDTAQRKTAAIMSATAGEVSYKPTEADTETVAKIRLEWEITFGDGSVMTVPSEDYIILDIIADLG